MRPSTVRLGLPSAAWIAVALGVAPIAHAADEAACMTAHQRGQMRRLDQQPSAARDELLVCAAPECPPLIRADCARWVAEVEAMLATVVVEVYESGQARVPLSVMLDGKRLEGALDREVYVEPGGRLLRVELVDGRSRDERLILVAGERGRRVRIDFPAAQPPPSDRRRPQPASRPSEEEPVDDAPHPIPAASYALGAVGLVGLGLFIGFAIRGKQQENDLEEGCAPRCAKDDVDAMYTSYLVADVSLGIGGAALAAAVIVLAAWPREPSATATISVAPVAGGVAAIARARF